MDNKENNEEAPPPLKCEEHFMVYQHQGEEDWRYKPIDFPSQLGVFSTYYPSEEDAKAACLKFFERVEWLKWKGQWK